MAQITFCEVAIHGILQTEEGMLMRGTCAEYKFTFSGMGAFDKHRTGSYGEPIYRRNNIVGYTPHERRCMSKDEMLNAGLIEKNGMWGFPIDEKAQAYFKQLKSVR